MWESISVAHNFAILESFEIKLSTGFCSSLILFHLKKKGNFSFLFLYFFFFFFFFFFFLKQSSSPRRSACKALKEMAVLS